MPDCLTESPGRQRPENHHAGIYWGQFKQELFRRCIHWTQGNRAAADDLVAQTALSLVRQRTALHTLDNPRAWIVRVAWNLFIDNCRIQRSYAQFAERYGQEQLLIGRSSEGSPEERLLRTELFAQINEAMAQLPDAQRRAFEMRTFEEASYQQIAETLDITCANARKRVQLARDTIKLRVKGYLTSR